MSTLRFGVLALLVGALYAGALQVAVSQTISSRNKPCLRDYSKYQKNPEHKAFVITVGKFRLQSCGSSWGYVTKNAAVTQAFKECTTAAARAKIPIKACRLLNAQ